MRENAQSKGRRYLTDGRLMIRLVDAREIRAHCRGQGELYNLGHEPGRGWYCSCPARGRCSHLVALQCVTTRTHSEREVLNG